MKTIEKFYRKIAEYLAKRVKPQTIQFTISVSFTTVSYTHLDVYKRQALDRADLIDALDDESQHERVKDELTEIFRTKTMHELSLIHI